MMRVGLVGWRGMVGSVLMQRMRAEGDFELIEPVFFTTSNVGGEAPPEGRGVPLKHMTRHLTGLFQGQRGARGFRRYLAENAHLPGAGPETILRAARVLEPAAA